MLLDGNVITNGLWQHCSVVSTICHHRSEIEEKMIQGAKNRIVTGSRPLYLPILSSVLVESLNGGACVHPGGASNCLYYIQFQVWRPSGSGCYSLVGFNRPVGNNGGDGFLSPPGDRNDPLRRCVVLPVTEDQQIQVQSGDVVGYYADYFRNGEDRNDGGIQGLENHNNVVVHYKDVLPREAIKSHYALGGPNPTECGFPISCDSISYSLGSVTSAAPIISLSFGVFVLSPWLLSLLNTITVTIVPIPSVSVSSSDPVGIGEF